MTSNTKSGISSDRVKDTNEVNVTHLECLICHNILWTPVACQSCETPFCSSCIQQCLTNNPNKCPYQCEKYTERKCPPFIAKLLSQLQISCLYKSNGCTQIISYEALDKHETDCSYQFQKCPGCQSQILIKDYDNHVKDCASIKITCEDCQLVYKRGETSTKHTEMICLKQQLRRMKEEHKREIQELTNQLNEMCILNPSIKKSRIIFEDLPSAEEKFLSIPKIYKGLKWTEISYAHQVYMTKTRPKSGYVTSFTTRDTQQVAYFSKQASISTQDPNESFHFDSLTACAAWNDNLQLKITSFRDSQEVNTHTATLLFGKPQLILLEWKNINKIVFLPSGGTAHPDTGGGSGPHTVLTQITIDQGE